MAVSTLLCSWTPVPYVASPPHRLPPILQPSETLSCSTYMCRSYKAELIPRPPSPSSAPTHPHMYVPNTRLLHCDQINHITEIARPPPTIAYPSHRISQIAVPPRGAPHPASASPQHTKKHRHKTRPGVSPQSPPPHIPRYDSKGTSAVPPLRYSGSLLLAIAGNAPANANEAGHARLCHRDARSRRYMLQICAKATHLG
jgi:hypothetical protein